MGGDEQEIEQRAIDAVRADSPRLREAYRRKFGTEISTDNAREIVSPEYASSKEERTRLSAATQKPSGMLADELFDEALRNPDPQRPHAVLMTAGGTGAGKTTSLRGAPGLAENGQFVFDSNLGSKRSSVQKIEAANAAGNQVRIGIYPSGSGGGPHRRRTPARHGRGQGCGTRRSREDAPRCR